MTALNAVMVRVAEVVMVPLQGTSPLVGVLVLALITALVVLGVMRLASDQQAVAAVKRAIHADLLEMRLYNDDVRALLRAQVAVLKHNGRYIWLSFMPVLLTAIPLTLAIAQLQSWYGYLGLSTGVPTLVTVDLQGPAPSEPLSLDAPGLLAEGPPAYFPSLNQAVWRVVPREVGEHVMHVRVGTTIVDKTWSSSSGIASRSPSRDRAGFVTQLLYPTEPPLPDGPVTAVRLAYPERTIHVFGMDLHWLVVFVAAAFGCVLALRKPLGVVI